MTKVLMKIKSLVSTIPQESFIDIDSDVLNYSAVLIDNTGNETALRIGCFDVNTKPLVAHRFDDGIIKNQSDCE